MGRRCVNRLELMSKRDKMGAAILIALFVALGVLLAVFTERADKVYRPEDSPIVQQRIKNLEKSRSLNP